MCIYLSFIRKVNKDANIHKQQSTKKHGFTIEKGKARKYSDTSDAILLNVPHSDIIV